MWVDQDILPVVVEVEMKTLTHPSWTIDPPPMGDTVDMAPKVGGVLPTTMGDDMVEEETNIDLMAPHIKSK